jgi:hypothetical protein
VIANSLFLPGCWKTTWAWIKEAGRKPNEREEKQTSLAVMLDQGLAKETQAKGHFCKPSRNVDSRKLVLAVMLDQGPAKETQAKGHLCKPSHDVDSRKARALLCKPSRDEDSCKSILAVMLDQGLARKTQEKGHLCKPDGYIWKPKLKLAGHGVGNRKEKGKRDNWNKGIGTRIRIARTGEGYQVSLTLVPRTSHLTRRRSTRPPPPALFTPQSTLSRPQRSTPHARTRSLQTPWPAGCSLSVQQPCELHVWPTAAVILRLPRPSIPCRLFPSPTLRSGAGPTSPS